MDYFGTQENAKGEPLYRFRFADGVTDLRCCLCTWNRKFGTVEGAENGFAKHAKVKHRLQIMLPRVPR